MSDYRDYREILLSESLASNDSSSDWEPSGETFDSQDTWSSQSSEESSSQSSEESSSQDSSLDSSQKDSV